MSISQAKVERYNETHMLGKAQMTHKAGTEEVLFVAPMPPKDKFDPHGIQELDHNARYFSSPLVARTNWEDLAANVKSVPAFTGRDEGTMEAHLVKNFKA